MIRRPPISTLSPYTTLFRSTTTKLAPTSGRKPPGPCAGRNPPALLSLGERLRRTADVHKDLRHAPLGPRRSEEHTSELQSRQYLVCRLLLEKKKNIDNQRAR